MKALTVYQPWASLIMIGAKPYEFRGWVPPQKEVGQRHVIHAAKRPIDLAEVRMLLMRLRSDSDFMLEPCLHRDKAIPFLERVLSDPTSLPLAHGLGTAVLGHPKPGHECAREFGVVAGNDSDREQHFNWGWPYSDIQPFEPPVPARGAQGLWTWRGGHAG
ncbi:MAG: hypothetical protein ACK4Q4_00630 [Rhodocyclaceae bacterium]